MQTLTNAQKKHLRGLANNLPAGIIIGKNGLTEQVLASIDEALTAHELVKIKYNEYKEEKAKLDAEITEHCQCLIIGGVGYTTVIFRQHPDPKERSIKLL